MRRAFAQALVAATPADAFFLTGDLGFMALEEVRDAFGPRFLNAGVAEQNMIGLAAGLAREGFTVFVYSIAPFVYARPFEQIRLDLGPQNLPVWLVGNGGGYGYGIMGRTHHALEDMGVLTAIGVRAIAPAFNADIPFLLNEPPQVVSYLRLGRDEAPAGVTPPPYAPWRRVLAGGRGALAALGPLAGVAWATLADLPEETRPAVWAVSELAPQHIPAAFFADLAGAPLFIFEEHVAAGGLGQHICLELARRAARPSRFQHRFALGWPDGRHGSQAFHRACCGLDAAAMRALVLEER